MSRYSNLLSKLNPANHPALIAAQLKNPHGLFAKKVALKMNESNKNLYSLVLDNMCSVDGDKMLEIGFGNGNFFMDFINKAKGIKMYGVEFSKSMLDQASKMNVALINGNHLNIQLVDNSQLPYNEHFFNAVIAVNLVYFWNNPKEHLKEIHRVLQPGGKFYIGLRPAEILSKLPFSQFGFHLRTEKEWIEILEQEKFSFIHSQISKEPNIIMSGKSYPMQGQCMVFEKD